MCQLSPPEWPVLDSVVEYETGWYTGGYDHVVQPDGREKRYYWAELPTAVTIVAKDGTDVLFVEQYRPTIRHTQLELPAGIVESDESLVSAGRRELREETGYEAGEIEVLQEVWVATGVLRHKRAIVFATDLTQTERDLDQNEFLEVYRVPVDEALQTARSPPANEATLVALLLAREADLL